MKLSHCCEDVLPGANGQHSRTNPIFKPRRRSARLWLADRCLANRHRLTIAGLFICVAALRAGSYAQDALPFAVSNPKHLDWSTDEAGRIYSSACELVAREIRPDKPPRLTPKFTLVLGSQEDETVRVGTMAEVHLKAWNATHFAEAMVLMASREILKSEDVLHLTRDTLRAADASVSVAELKKRK